MSQGIKIIMLIVAGVIAVGLIVVYIVPRSPTPESVLENVVPPAGGTPSPRSHLAEQGETLFKDSPIPAPSPLTQADTTQAQLTAASRSFAERYGTFSSDADFSNITDLYGVMSLAFLARSEAYVQKAQNSRKPNEPVAITTTTVLTVQVFDMPFGVITGSATVNTQRSQIKGSDAPKTWYQYLNLSFVKEEGAWKVDSAVWK